MILMIFVAIDEHEFFVKKKHIGMMITCGHSINNLYHPSKHNIIDYKMLLGVRTSLVLCYHRLGHLANLGLNGILNSIPVQGSKHVDLYLFVLLIRVV